MKKLIPLLLVFTISINANAGYYYFHDEPNPLYPDAKLMDASRPSTTYISSINIDEAPAIWAMLPVEKDTKISGDISIGYWVEAYTKITFIPFQIRFIKLYLIDISPEGDIDVIASTSPRPLFFFKNDTIKSDTVSFNNVEYMLPSHHLLGVKIEKTVDILSYLPLAIFSTLFDTNILYDSINALSYASIPLEIGGGINIECWNKEKSTKPGREVTYNLLVYNKGTENDKVTLSTDYSDGWMVEINPDELFIEGNSVNTSVVTVIPPFDAKEGDYLNITIIAQGSTGYDSIWLNTTVVAFIYRVAIEFFEESLEGEPGKNLTIPFSVRNTGDLSDTYKLKVISNWSCSLEEREITLRAGENRTINLTVEIPKNAKSGEMVEVEASSPNAHASDFIAISITIPAEEESKWGIGFILFIIFTAFLLFIAYYISRETGKGAIIACEKRSIELPPGGRGSFSLLIQNPLKRRMKYRIAIEGKIPSGWRVYANKQEIMLDEGEKEEIKVNVFVPEKESLQEWASIDFVLIPDKGRKERINMLVTLREEMPILKTEFQHEPKDFSEGEKVITKVRIENTGEKNAENKKVILIVNGREKNRIEGVEIPANSIVEIEIPWIAEKENNVEVKIE
ncbi:MAG: hypothetical protein QW762_01205 [Candidatus Thermoplasmatota archaeon]